MSEWNECWYCGKILKRSEITFDHIEPESWGGDKMVTSCKPCNNLKGESSIQEFKEFLGIDMFHGEKKGYSPW